MSDAAISTVTLDRASGERFRSLRTALGVKAFGINLITLQPGQRNRIHKHLRQEEVYVVLEGELTVVIEGEEQRFGVDAVVRVPPPVRRQLANRGPEPVVVLALGGSTEHTDSGVDGVAWTSWEEGGEGHQPARSVPQPDDFPAR